MLTAVFEYRDEWSAHGDVDLKFYGDNGIPEKLSTIAHLICFQNYYENNIIIEFLEKLKKENGYIINEIKVKIDIITKKHKLLFLHKNAKNEILNLRKQWTDLIKKSDDLNEKIEQYKDARFLPTYKCVELYRNLLNSFGFKCTASNRDSNRETVEYYECTMPIYKVLDLITEKTTKLTKLKESKIEKAKNIIKLCKAKGDLSALDNTYISLNM